MKIVGITSDGAPSMTGSFEGTVTYIQKEAQPGFVRVWCGFHQLDILVQKMMTIVSYMTIFMVSSKV